MLMGMSGLQRVYTYVHNLYYRYYHHEYCKGTYLSMMIAFNTSQVTDRYNLLCDYYHSSTLSWSKYFHGCLV